MVLFQREIFSVSMDGAGEDLGENAGLQNVDDSAVVEEGVSVDVRDFLSVGVVCM